MREFLTGPVWLTRQSGVCSGNQPFGDPFARSPQACGASVMIMRCQGPELLPFQVHSKMP